MPVYISLYAPLDDKWLGLVNRAMVLYRYIGPMCKEKLKLYLKFLLSQSPPIMQWKAKAQLLQFKWLSSTRLWNLGRWELYNGISDGMARLKKATSQCRVDLSDCF